LHHYSYISTEYAKTYAEKSSADKPSETIPDDLVKKLIKTKHVNHALASLRQLFISTYDMANYTPSSHDEVLSIDFSERFNKLRSEITIIDGLEIKTGQWDWGHGQGTFGHLITGYDAGYYGYLRYNMQKILDVVPLLTCFQALKFTRQICSIQYSQRTQ
jgi:metallopeptidase MepB